VITLADRWAYAVAALAGAVSWLAIAHATSRREAWDSEIYFVYALPGLWLFCGVLGALAPSAAWRWGFVMFFAQAVVMIVQTHGGSLLPLGVMLFAIFGVIGAGSAQAGAWLRRWAQRYSSGAKRA
jgi:hypothetical protein